MLILWYLMKTLHLSKGVEVFITLGAHDPLSQPTKKNIKVIILHIRQTTCISYKINNWALINIPS